MSLKPGISGQPTELLDGAKVDYIREYTLGNGTQLQGRTNGIAIEAGKVGEVKTGVITAPGSLGLTSIVLTAMTGSLELSAGVWSIHYGAILRHQGYHTSTYDYLQGASMWVHLSDGITNVSSINHLAVVPYTPSNGGSGCTVERAHVLNVGNTATVSLKYEANKDTAVTLTYRSITNAFLWAVRIA